MKTIYEARDRQGLKYFSRKPKFLAMHDILIGDQITRPSRKCRIIRRFTAKVEHRGMSASFYPQHIRINP